MANNVMVDQTLSGIDVNVMWISVVNQQQSQAFKFFEYFNCLDRKCWMFIIIAIHIYIYIYIYIWPYIYIYIISFIFPPKTIKWCTGVITTKIKIGV